ncbi:MAG TPA: STAS domain-containing protein [Ktedonobacterales bacterium]|nr:STAS domain-containing protein [Ktedonobacterales bacterium]
MYGANTQVGVRQASDVASIIDLEGEVTGSAEQALMSAYAEASRPTTRVVLLNFSKLVYMNSSGIGLLVTLLIRIRRQRQQLWACGLSEHYRHIFELTRLNDAIRLFDGEAEALEAAHML